MVENKLYIYGRYDSRGGTTAIVVPEHSNQWLHKAHKSYVSSFAWDGDDALTARERNTLAADLISDYIGAAVIFSDEADDMDIGVDLEPCFAIIADTEVHESGTVRKLEAVLIGDGTNDSFETLAEFADTDTNEWGGPKKFLTGRVFHPDWYDDGFSFVLRNV